MFVDVALKIRSEKILTYSVPDNLESAVALGKRVLVPLGNRKIVGCILAVAESRDIKNPRAILDVLDPEPLFSGAGPGILPLGGRLLFLPGREARIRNHPGKRLREKRKVCQPDGPGT